MRNLVSGMASLRHLAAGSVTVNVLPERDVLSTVDVAAVCADDSTRHGQADAGAIDAVRAARGAPHELREDRCCSAGGMPRPSSRTLIATTRPRRVARRRSRASVAGVLHGVLEQVADRAAECVAVGVSPGAVSIRAVDHEALGRAVARGTRRRVPTQMGRSASLRTIRGTRLLPCVPKSRSDSTRCCRRLRLAPAPDRTAALAGGGSSSSLRSAVNCCSEVSGVRNSCETAETKSDWSRATSSSCETPRATTTAPASTTTRMRASPASTTLRRELLPSRLLVPGLSVRMSVHGRPVSADDRRRADAAAAGAARGTWGSGFTKATSRRPTGASERTHSLARNRGPATSPTTRSPCSGAAAAPGCHSTVTSCCRAAGQLGPPMSAPRDATPATASPPHRTTPRARPSREVPRQSIREPARHSSQTSRGRAPSGGRRGLTATHVRSHALVAPIQFCKECVRARRPTRSAGSPATCDRVMRDRSS